MNHSFRDNEGVVACMHSTSYAHGMGGRSCAPMHRCGEHNSLRQRVGVPLQKRRALLPTHHLHTSYMWPDESLQIADIILKRVRARGCMAGFCGLFVGQKCRTRTGRDRIGQGRLTEIEQGLHYIICTTYAYARQSDADKSKVSDAYMTARTHA